MQKLYSLDQFNPYNVLTEHTTFPNSYRLGDTIALFDLASYIASVKPGRTFSTRWPLAYGELLASMATDPLPFSVPDPKNIAYFDDVNLWIWNDYLRSIDHRVWYKPPAINYDGTILFAPLLDVEYSFERTMHIEFALELARELSRSFGGTIDLLLAPDMNGADVRRFMDLANDPTYAIGIYQAPLREAMAMIAACRVFIGGDTGLTHFAGHVEDTAVVTLHDRRNTLRHRETKFDHKKTHREMIRDTIRALGVQHDFDEFFPHYYSGPNHNEGSRQVLFDRHGCDGQAVGETVRAVRDVMGEVGV